MLHLNPLKIYLFYVIKRKIRKKYEMCSKLTIKTYKRRQWCRCGVFTVNFKHISHILSSVSMVNFEQVNICWVNSKESNPDKFQITVIRTQSTVLELPWTPEKCQIYRHSCVARQLNKNGHKKHNSKSKIQAKYLKKI